MVPLAPDAFGDNQFMDMPLNPEHIQPHDSPRFPLLGKADMPLAANSQVKHGMRSWWLTCSPSSKQGRKIGSGRVAIH